MRHSSRVHKRNFLLHKKVIHPDCKIRKLLYYVKKEEVDDDDENNNDEKISPFWTFMLLVFVECFL